jgi:hypothetical protein
MPMHWVREGGASYTLQVPRRNAFAHITLSTFTPAQHSDSAGTGAGVRIVKYTSFKPLSHNVWIEVPTFLPVDWNTNSIYIEQCASITFGMMVKNAWAYGGGVVFVR